MNIPTHDHMEERQARSRGLPAQAGITTMMVVAFMGIFMIILGTITSYAFQEAKYGRALYGREQAIHIAESGLEYYRWFLAHNPNNLTNGTGLPGPYTYTVSDPEGSAIGSASLTISGNTQCNVIQSIDITSKGTANANPTYPRTLFARYMQQSVAAYSYLLNSNVWAGADRMIVGPYFSNGGIRMDASSNSDVSSALSTWTCDASFGCSPSASKAGVFGVGSGSALWKFPATSIDFGAINVDLAALKNYARNAGGVYYAPATGTATQRGYQLKFKSDGTVDIYRVSATNAVPSYSDDSTDSNRSNGWTLTEYSLIKTEVFLGNVTIPTTCGVIFIEDHAWIEGVVKGKVTVAVATPSDATTQPSAYLVNNLTYATNDGTSGITIVAEGNVLIPLNVPDLMEIHGIFIAEYGHYGRNFYTADSGNYGSYAVSASWAPYVIRARLTTEGTVVSNLRTGTSWDCGNGTCSGFQNRVDAYDELQATNPPPFTPSASTDYRFVLWREQ